MSQITGIVQAVNAREVTTKWGKKNVYDIVVDGNTFNAGFSKPAFGIGDAVTFDSSTGKYGNDITKGSLKAAGSIPQTQSPIAAKAAPPPVQKFGGYERTFPVGALSPERAIIRQNSLTNARELVLKNEDKELSNKALAEEVIAVARIFEAYSAGDLDVEEVKAEVAAKGDK